MNKHSSIYKKKFSSKSKFSFFILHSSFFILSALLISCNTWLDVKPNNEQVTTDYWQSKEQVEAVVASGYYQMRTAVPTLIKWGELRGGAMYTSNTSDAKLQDFNLISTNTLCNYATLYKVIGYANSVLHYAKGVQDVDDTYYDAVLNSHLCEAYFQRAYCYFILAKNYGDVPLITEAYVDDTQDFNVPKTSEDSIYIQIKADVEAALLAGAAKGTYETDWQTKGRVTKWALYALMADVSLWTEDYETCRKYCDMILNATDTFRPAFLSRTQDWYTIFYPGNSNESIFELNWSYELNQETNNFSTSLFQQSTASTLRFTNQALEKMNDEENSVLSNSSSTGERDGRMYLATFVGVSTGSKVPAYLWKYYGNDIADQEGGARVHQDANFIIYRVAEIILMKAQADVMTGNYDEAIQLINKIRSRAGLTDISADEYNTEQSLLEEILNQKEMEFMGEAKRWYDVFWYSRISNKKYRSQAIDMICEGNQTTNTDWIRSVLTDANAWYMPLPYSDVEHNQNLVQNPYYN